MPTKRLPRGNWIVRVSATVIKEVYAENCTEDEARANPFNYALEEEELDQVDWKVLSVTSNN